jgi:hypothetical protein
VVFKTGGGSGIGCECTFEMVPSQNIFVVFMLNKFKNSSSSAGSLADILQQCFNIQRNGARKSAGEGD